MEALCGAGKIVRVQDHSEPTEEYRDALLMLAISGRLGATLYHDTPRGVRLIYILDQPLRDKKLWAQASQHIGKHIESILIDENLLAFPNAGKPGFTVDRSVQERVAHRAIGGEPRGLRSAFVLHSRIL